MTTPNRPPLWEVMSDACADHPRGVVDLRPAAVAAMIRALRDWLVPEEPEPRQQDMTEEEFWQHDPTPRHERQRIRALLTAEADQAERGDG